MKNKKITKATLKSFLRKNYANVYIKILSEFSGMIDCVEQVEDTFCKAEFTDKNIEHNLGFVGLWLVGSSRDSFSYFENDQFEGIKYYNCCGSGIMAIKK